jgi:hypothetical protein
MQGQTDSKQPITHQLRENQIELWKNVNDANYVFLNLVDILVDVHELGCLIRQGETDEAVNLTKKLAEQRVQLEATPYTQQNEEKEIKYEEKESFFLFYLNNYFLK